MIFSGSAVVDSTNTSGFAKSGQTPMVAIYTGHREESQQTKRLEDQRLAYSNDRGRTWTQYSGNPVIDIGSPEPPSLAGPANGNREAAPPWMERSVRRHLGILLGLFAYNCPKARRRFKGRLSTFIFFAPFSPY